MNRLNYLMCFASGFLVACDITPIIKPNSNDNDKEIVIEKVGEFKDDNLRESSGIVKSRQFSNVFWTHNDSGNPPELFAVDSLGKIHKTFLIENARNIDWEDITIDPKNNLYIADVGNNNRNRDDLIIYRIQEPNPFDPNSKAVLDGTYPISYPQSNYDCEAVFWMDGKLYFITKSLGDTTNFFALDSLTNMKTQTLRFLGWRTDLLSTTAADYSDTLLKLAVLSYDQVTILNLNSENFGSAQKIISFIFPLTISLTQTEAICWDRKEIIVTNEHGDIYRIRNLKIPY